MSDDPTEGRPEADPLSRAVRSKTARKLRTLRRGNGNLWFGFGMFGLIGWSVALPTLLGAAAGRWLDAHHAGGRSWTLALLVAGLILGCAQAYHWVSREEKQINKEDPSDD